jgi:hypothetical protein
MIMDICTFLFRPTFTLSAQQRVIFFVYGVIKELVKNLYCPTKKASGYDFCLKWTEHKNRCRLIRIAVNTSIATDIDKANKPLYIKALSIDSKSHFDMNFQQIKPKCADVFLWVAVWRDKIRYWVLNSDELKKNKYFSR